MARRAASGWLSACANSPARSFAAKHLHFLVRLQIPTGHRVGPYRTVGVLGHIVVGDLGEVEVERVDRKSVLEICIPADGLVRRDQHVLKLDLHEVCLRAACSPASERDFRKMLAARASQHQLGGCGVNALGEFKFAELGFADAAAGADYGRSAGLPDAKSEAHQIDFALV